MPKKSKKEDQKEIVQKILDVDFKEIMETSYLEYSLEVLGERAIPNIKDGLKPVQRRVLYDMDVLHIPYNSSYRKCARIVGDTMGKYHPHGDSSIYGALVNMAQDFKMSIPLIDGHGNFGNIDGDGAAAMRYTESRLSKIASLMLGPLENIVPFQPNFDETDKEPVVLPCKFPNLLLNGTDGIAVGLISSIPTHNLVELNNMLIAYIKKDPTSADRALGKENPLTVAKLLDILNGPDFPTGGTIVNKKDLLDIYSTGEGKIIVRGKVVEEVIDGKPCLVITEIPYSSSGKKEALIEKIATLILDKKLDGVNEIKDESDKELRIVIECKKGTDLSKIENKLYKLSPLQDSLTIRFVAIRDCGIKTFSLKDYCREFVDFQRLIYTKEFEEKLKKDLQKEEILNGLVIAMDYIDIIIDAIRHAEKVEFAKRCLMTGNTSNIKWSSKKNETTAKKFSFTEAQAENILSTTLRKLNTLEFEEIIDNLDNLRKEIENIKNILSDSKQLDKIIINHLQAISKEYGVERKTNITDSTIVEYKEEKKYDPCNILYDKYGYIKIMDDSNFSKLEESNFENCKLARQTTTEDNLWCFTNEGMMYQLKLDKIPFNKTKDRGFFLEPKIGKPIEGKVIFVTTRDTSNKFIFLTKKGFIKIVDKKELESTRTITNSTKLQDGDEVLKMFEINDDNKEILIVDDKNYLKFDIEEIAEQKKTAVGVASIKTSTEIIDASLVVDDKAFINMKEIDTLSLKKQKRGSKGSKISF